jgi:hypothetical protein
MTEGKPQKTISRAYNGIVEIIDPIDDRITCSYETEFARNIATLLPRHYRLLPEHAADDEVIVLGRFAPHFIHTIRQVAHQR